MDAMEMDEEAVNLAAKLEACMAQEAVPTDALAGGQQPPPPPPPQASQLLLAVPLVPAALAAHAACEGASGQISAAKPMFAGPSAPLLGAAGLSAFQRLDPRQPLPQRLPVPAS